MPELNKENAGKITRCAKIEQLPISEMIQDVKNEAAIAKFIPDSICQIDPRNGQLVIYNSSRAGRLHMGSETKIVKDENEQHHNCPICQGKSTGIIDIADQSEGFTFINKNLYPVFYPNQQPTDAALETPLYPDREHRGRMSYGFHFLQWTSSKHDKDWHNLPLEDCLVCFQRLQVIEKKLLSESKGFMPPSEKDADTYGYVTLIKNYGLSAGASLTHGHQQIGYSNIMPHRYYNNLGFLQRNNREFTKFLMEENPQDLLIRDYGPVMLLIPYFMKRPYDMILLLKDSSKKYLHELNAEETQAMTLGIQDTIRLIIQIMSLMDKPPAYNFVLSNGPGAGLYIEFFPRIQKTAGFEQIGVWVCQAEPHSSAEQAQEILHALNRP